MSTPTFLGLDGIYRSNWVFSTDVPFRFFQGQMDPNTVDMQVSINGAPLAANPDLIIFEDNTFTIPNPSAYPQGLQLFPGSNTIQVLSILTNGAPSLTAQAQATLNTDRNVLDEVVAPSGISVEQLDRTVQINVTGLTDPNVIGYNIYASTASGGGLSGYQKINLNPIITSTTREVVTDLADLTADSILSTDANGNLTANPLFYRVQGTQVDKSQNLIQTDYDQMLQVPQASRHLRTTLSVSTVTTIQIFSFVHDRTATATSTTPTISVADFTAIADTDPLYYVVTAIYNINGSEYESSLSQEVAGAPIIVTPVIANLPTVSRQQIVQDTALAINRSRPEVAVQPGSYTRDTFIDPFSTEAERIRFIIGFMQACQSFPTLIAIDDPTNSGSSIAVSQSPYKTALQQAFFLQDTTSVQNMIDNAFDHLAAQKGVIRSAGQRARGQATFYRTTPPTTTQALPIGTTVTLGGQVFQTTSAANISAFGAGNYDPTTGRWAATAFVLANQVGSAGNVAPSTGTITNGPPGLSVTNTSAMYGGLDTQTNEQLATTCQQALSGVDSGTQQGYTKTTANVGSVQQVNVVDAGHPLMQRDLDLVTGNHTGGKVDVWIRGSNVATVDDTFAFSFQTVVGGQVEPVGSPSDLTFRVVNPLVTPTNPIIEILNIPAYGMEFNVVGDSSLTLNLTNVQITAYDTFQLDSTQTGNSGINLYLTDQYTCSYRFQTSNSHVFESQPVTSIISLTDDEDGSVTDPSQYALFTSTDPVGGLGNTTEAGNFLQATATGSIPSGSPIQVTGEQHGMLPGPEYLDSYGVNPYTVVVTSLDGSVTYNGPFSPVGTSIDYTIIAETTAQPLAIQTVSGSQIVNGQQVLVNYYHDPNYTVQYTVNSLVEVAQNAIDSTRHATADVLAKAAVEVPVDITGTVILLPNQDSGVVGGAIGTALGNLFNSLGLAQPVRQTDIIKAIEGVAGVDYMVVPMTHIGRQDGAYSIRETVTAAEPSDWMVINAWSTSAVTAYLLVNPLLCGTTDGGGPVNEYRGVYFNDVPQNLINGLPQYNGQPVIGQINSAVIIGNEGMLIPGIGAAPGRQVIVFLPSGTLPSAGTITVTYIVSDDAGVKDIVPGAAEFLSLGNLDFTYDAGTDVTSVLNGTANA